MSAARPGGCQPRRWSGWAAILTTLLLAACTSSAAPAPRSGTDGAGSQAKPAAAGQPAAASQPAAPRAWDEQALYEAAKQEGLVTMYGTVGEREVIDHVRPLWEQRYPGIRVEVVEGNSPQTQERVLTEQRVGNVKGDLVIGGSIDLYRTMTTDSGYLADPVELPEASAVLPVLQEHYAPAGGRVVAVRTLIYGLLVNTSVLRTEQDRPTSYADLLEPRFKGQAVAHDPRIDGPGNYWFLVASRAPNVGEDYLRRLYAEQDVRLDTSPREFEIVVVRGERGVGLGMQPRQLVANPGAPLQWIVPREGVLYIPIGLGMLKNAPHPNAAQLYMNFRLSEEAQRAEYQKIGSAPSRVVSGLENEPYLLSGKPLLGIGTVSWAMLESDIPQGRKLAEEIVEGRR
jgi:iron(III) transport system substrate-binding protein